MAHLSVKKSYQALSERLNRFPQGAPPSQTLFKILEILFSEKEAQLVAQLPIKPFTAEQAAACWKLGPVETQKLLNDLAGRAILVDIHTGSRVEYVLPPPMAGFFEFSLMRTRGDINQKLLGELFYQYMNVEEDFIRELFTNGETQLGRTFIHEPVLTNDNALHVLDYERASEVIETASHIGVGLCYCRHKMEHVGKNCDAAMEICMTFNTCAEAPTRAGAARSIDRVECHDLLQQAYAQNLVQFGENVREGVNFICNCCGCCCEAMIAARRFAHLDPVHTTNFLPRIAEENCSGCGACANLCPVEAMGMVSANDPHQPKRRKARVDETICLGCGVCLRGCNEGAMSLKEREKRVITPLNSSTRTVMMAIERGTLQHLVFDNRVLTSHRALAALLGVVLRLPPVKRVLASRQLQSRYLERMIERYEAAQAG